MPNCIAKQIITFSQQSLSTQSDSAKELIKNNVVLVKAIEEMGEEIADMDEEIEEQNEKICFLKNKIGISDKDFVEEWSQVKFKKQDIERETRILNRMKRREERHKALTE